MDEVLSQFRSEDELEITLARGGGWIESGGEVQGRACEAEGTECAVALGRKSRV